MGSIRTFVRKKEREGRERKRREISPPLDPVMMDIVILQWWGTAGSLELHLLDP